MKKMKEDKEGVFTEMGARLRKIRGRLKMSQKDFAKALDITGGYLSTIESGLRNPPFELLHKISQYYDISLNYLALGVGDMFLIDSHRGLMDRRKIIEDIETLDDLIWVCQRVPMVRYSVMAHATEFFYEHLHLIKSKLEESQKDF